MADITQPLTPIATYTQELVKQGVPLETIVHIVESHYQGTIKELEDALRESNLGNLRHESSKSETEKLRKANAELKAQLYEAQQRANGLHKFTASRALQSVHMQQRRERESMDNPRALLQAAAEQEFEATPVAPGSHGTSGSSPPNSAGAIPQGSSAMAVAREIATQQEVEHLRRQLERAFQEASNRKAQYDRERGRRLRVESESHVLQLSTLGLHDEISKLSGALEQARDRSLQTAAAFEEERNDLRTNIAELRTNLEAIGAHYGDQLDAQHKELVTLRAEVARQEKRYEALRIEYYAATAHNEQVAKKASEELQLEVAMTLTREALMQNESQLAASALTTPASNALTTSTAGPGMPGAGDRGTMQSLHAALKAAVARATTAEDVGDKLRREIEALRAELAGRQGTLPRLKPLTLDPDATSEILNPRVILKPTNVLGSGAHVEVEKPPPAATNTGATAAVAVVGKDSVVHQKQVAGTRTVRLAESMTTHPAGPPDQPVLRVEDTAVPKTLAPPPPAPSKAVNPMPAPVGGWASAQRKPPEPEPTEAQRKKAATRSRHVLETGFPSNADSTALSRLTGAHPRTQVATIDAAAAFLEGLSGESVQIARRRHGGQAPPRLSPLSFP